MKTKEHGVLSGIRNCVKALNSPRTSAKRRDMAQKKLELLLWLATTPVKKQALQEFPWLKKQRTPQKVRRKVRDIHDNVIPFPDRWEKVVADLLIMNVKKGAKKIEQFLEAGLNPEITLYGDMFWDKDPCFKVQSLEGKRTQGVAVGEALVFIKSGLSSFDRRLRSEGTLAVEISGKVMSRNGLGSFLIMPDNLQVKGELK